MKQFLSTGKGGKLIFYWLHAQVSSISIHLVIRSEVSFHRASSSNSIDFELPLEWLDVKKVDLSKWINTVPLRTRNGMFERLLDNPGKNIISKCERLIVNSICN